MGNKPELPDIWGTRFSMREIHIFAPGNSEKELWARLKVFSFCGTLIFQRKPLFLSEVCWRSGVPLEGENQQRAIKKPSSSRALSVGNPMP
jgi:hypothetical protein